MAISLEKEIETLLKSNHAEKDIREELLEKGYLEEDITRALRHFGRGTAQKDPTDTRKYVKRLKQKVMLDRVGYGFAPLQHVNILLSIAGANLFIIGIVNALKSGIGTIFSSFLKEYSKSGNISKRTISMSGLVFGFSFLFMALAVSIKSVPIFCLSLLLGSLGVVSYGDLFRNFIQKSLKKERLVIFLPKFTFIGLVVTAIATLLSGYLMQTIPWTGSLVTVDFLGFKASFRFFGYLIAFEITAFSFILSSYMLSKMNLPKEGQYLPVKEFIQDYIADLKMKAAYFLRNRNLVIMSITTMIIAVFHTAINSYIGIFIFQEYGTSWLKGFINVSVIYALAIIASFFGPTLTSKLHKYLGFAPMFVFGSLLMAILPLTIVYNRYLPAVVVANVLFVFGMAIIGSTQGLIAGRILSDRDRQQYYSLEGFITTLPFLAIAFLLAFLANSNGIIELFRYIGFGILILLIPLYITLVFWTQRIR